MSADDPPIGRVAPIGAEPVNTPGAPAPPPPSDDDARPATPPASPRPGQTTLASGVEQAELTAPVRVPQSVEERATVHDAALHGGRMARAIERARGSEPEASPGVRLDVNDRAQQLGGASAVAGSGQGAPAPSPADDEDVTDDHLDPFAPVSRIEAGSADQDARARHEHDNEIPTDRGASADADVRP